MTSLSLLLILVVATLSFGAVEPWARALVGLMTAVAFIIFAVRIRRFGTGGRIPRKRGIVATLSERVPAAGPFTSTQSRQVVFACAAVLAYGLFQLVPLPVQALKFLHPPFATLFALPVDVLPGPSVATQSTAFHAVSIYPFATEMELAMVAVYLMVFLMAAFGFRDKEDVQILLRMIILFAVLLALFAVLQKAMWTGKIYWLRYAESDRSLPFGPFINKNNYAGWMNLIIPITVAMGLSARRIDQKIRYLFAGAVMAVTVFFALSRGGVLSFVAGLFVLIIGLFTGRVTKRRLLPLFIFVAILVGFLVYLGMTPLLRRFAEIDIPHSERILIWRYALGAFLDFPVFGTGLGTFEHIFRLYHPPTWFFYNYAHNDYVQLLLETGIAGTTVAAIFLVVVMKAIFLTEWTEREVSLKVGFLASFTTIAAHSVTDFNLHVPSNAILLALLTGLAVSLSRLNEEEP